MSDAAMASVRQELVTLDDRRRWTACLEGIEHAFAHTWEHCNAMYATTHHATYLYSFEADGIRIVGPIAAREYAGTIDIVTPYGMSGFAGTGNHPAFVDAWYAFARSQAWVCGYIGLNPLLERHAPFPPQDRFSHNDIFVLDLGQELRDLEQGLSENRRRQLRAWPEGPYTLTRDRGRLSAFVHENAVHFFRSRGASSVYSFAPETWTLFTEVDNVLMLGAEKDGNVVAVTMVSYATTIGDYLFNFSTDEGTEASAPLLWFAALELRERGVKKLNLGGGIRPGDGVARFKQRFGARPVPLSALKQVYDVPRFESLCRAAGVDPNDREGFFPPYRVPRSS